MSQTSELAIIILHHNTPEFVIANLTALNKAFLPPNTQVVVINNGKPNANQSIQSHSFPNLNLKLLETPNNGFSAGNNFGIQQVSAKYYAFINPDIVVNQDTLQQLLSYLKAHPKVGIVAPQLNYPDGTIQDNYRVFPRIFDLIIKRISWLRHRFPKRMQKYLLWDREPNQNEAVDWVTGAFIVATRECLQAIHNHDQRYFLFMSDVAISREAYKHNFETHIVGSVRCLHNDVRISAGGLTQIFKKKILRIHILDAIKYFWHYKLQPLPANSPSVSNIKKKDRLLFAHKISGRSFLKKTHRKLQKNNPVVQVYEGEIDAKTGYNQPIVFFDTGVVATIQNSKNQYGLIKIWRHTPLQSTRKNTFPVFPAVEDLGIWSYETIRGGLEKHDTDPKQAILRELYEEAGITQSDILNIQDLGTIIGNTAIDIYRAHNFLITVKDDFQFKVHDEAEKITEFNFYEPSELLKLIQSNDLVCGISQASILQAMLQTKQ